MDVLVTASKQEEAKVFLWSLHGSCSTSEPGSNIDIQPRIMALGIPTIEEYRPEQALSLQDRAHANGIYKGNLLFFTNFDSQVEARLPVVRVWTQLTHQQKNNAL